MSRTISLRMLRHLPAPLVLERPAASRLQPLCIRTLSSTSRRLAEEGLLRTAPPTAEADNKSSESAYTSLLENDAPEAEPTFQRPVIPKPSPRPRSTLASVFAMPPKDLYSRPSTGAISPNEIGNIGGLGKQMSQSGSRQKSPIRPPPGLADVNDSALLSQLKSDYKEKSWQIHIYAHRHNVHITVVRPPGWAHPVTGKVYGGGNVPHRTPALSMTAGNLGFRKSAKKHYDSAFQLAVFVMSKMNDMGMSRWIDTLEVYLRGFGTGREAVTRVLLGPEGKSLRNKIIKVTDATRLKFGGTRSPKPRRLG